MSPGLDYPSGNQLAAWRAAVIGWVRSDWPDLTNRQLALLMIVCQEPGPHTVRGLAARLAVPKPVISRILDRLAELGLSRREIDRRDRRNVYAMPTPSARDLLQEFGCYFERPPTGE